MTAYSVKISHPAFSGEVVHYASLPFSWLVHVMEATDRDESIQRWFKLMHVAAMSEELRQKLAEVNMAEFKEILNQYLCNDVHVYDWELDHVALANMLETDPKGGENEEGKSV